MSGAHDLFWLAHYAYNKVNPLVGEDEKLIIHIGFDAGQKGVDIWIHSKTGSGVVAHKLGLMTSKGVDAFAATLVRESVV